MGIDEEQQDEAPEEEMIFTPYGGFPDWREWLDENRTRFEPDGRIIRKDFAFYQFLLTNNLREEAKGYLRDRWGIEYIAIARRVPKGEFIRKIEKIIKSRGTGTNDKTTLEEEV